LTEARKGWIKVENRSKKAKRPTSPTVSNLRVLQESTRYRVPVSSQREKDGGLKKKKILKGTGSRYSQ